MLPGDWERYDQTQRDKFEAWGADATRRMLTEGRLGERKHKIARARFDKQDTLSEADQREVHRDIAREVNPLAARALKYWQ